MARPSKDRSWVLNDYYKEMPLYKEAHQQVQVDKKIYLKYKQYRKDPVGFCEDIFGEVYTDEIKEVMQSVLVNKVTLVRSCTQYGKCGRSTDILVLKDGRIVTHAKMIGKQFYLPSYEPDGTQLARLATAFDNGVKPVYKITTSTGREINRTGNHPLLAHEHRSYKSNRIATEWKAVEELTIGESVAVPYKLNVGIKAKDHKGCGYVHFAYLDHAKQYILNNDFEGFLPDKVWSATDEILKELVHFVLVNKYGQNEGTQKVRLYSENKIREFELVMLRFGKIGTVVKGFEDDKEFWEWTSFNVSDLESWRLKDIPEGYFWDTIKSIEYIGDEPTVGITVEGSHTYVTTFVEHNTHSAARIGVWFMKTFPHAAVYTCTAPPEQNLQLLFWKQLDLIYVKFPHVFDNDEKKSVSLTNIFDPDNHITGLTIPSSGSATEKETKFSGKHSKFQLFIVDEADGVPEEVFKGIDGCQSGGIMQRLLILFNPRSKGGTPYVLERDKKAKLIVLNALNHPNVVTGEEIIPGCVDRDTTVTRFNEWTVPASEYDVDDIVEVPSYLVNFQSKRPEDSSQLYPPLPAGRRRIIDSAFYYKVLGEYPSQNVSQLIFESWIKKARDRYDEFVAKFGDIPKSEFYQKLIEMFGKPDMGLDVADTGGDGNVATFKYGNFVDMPVRWAGVDMVYTAEEAAKLFVARRCMKALVDGTGVGASVAPQMNRLNCKAHSVKVASSPTIVVESGVFDRLRDQIYWGIRDWLWKSEDAMLPPCKELLEELMIPTYEVVNGKIRIMSKSVMRDKLKRSPDFLDSLALCFAQQSDNLLHFYDHATLCDIKGTSIVYMDHLNKTSKEREITYNNLYDYGFIGMSQKELGWAFIRVWVDHENIMIIPEIWRTDTNDPTLIAQKVYETNSRRPLRAVGVYSDTATILRTSWNSLEKFLWSEFGENRMPELLSIRSSMDRTNRQISTVRNLTKKRQVFINTKLTTKSDIWTQFGTYESIPDDCRDALSGVITLVNNELS